MKISTTEWTPLTEDVYNDLDEGVECWLASKSGCVFPHKFVIDSWTKHADEITHIMRLVVPKHPLEVE